MKKRMRVDTPEKKALDRVEVRSGGGECVRKINFLERGKREDGKQPWTNCKKEIPLLENCNGRQQWGNIGRLNRPWLEGL